MNSRAGSEDGFTLLEVVCVLAIIGLVAAVLLPSVPRQTSRSRLEAYAIETANMLNSMNGSGHNVSTSAPLP